ncbi:MAG: KEOPS complex subunit Cgi121 [archaeon GB-1867-035]|nr:KEOPS complex subunit Cgi121 [Candidatus Culexmicrobium profundum]
MILNWKKADIKIYPLKIEGADKFRSLGVVAVSLSSKLNVNLILDVCRKVSSTHDVVIQVFNPNIIISLRHLLISVMKALRSFSEGRNICDKIEMEILLYISGRRQIRDALKIAGLPEYAENFISICIGSDDSRIVESLTSLIDYLNGKVDWNMLELNDEKISFLREVFNISEDELNIVVRRDLSFKDVMERLIIERCALLDVIK